MTAQRFVKNTAVKTDDVAVKEAIKVLFLHQSSIYRTTMARWVWICEVCGAIHSDIFPERCACCGVSTALVHQQDFHHEINSHW